MVSREEIEAVADNARLDLDDDEVEALQDDLDDILDSFASLDEIDTGGVEPSRHPIDGEGGTREDESGECLPRDEALANTDNDEDGYFVGPRSV